MKALPVFSLLLISSLSPAADWQPAVAPMLTSWGRELKPEQVWGEYPRPQLQREGWVNLNGLWEYAIVKADSDKPTAWDGRILVPFAPEASLSGVGRLLEPSEDLWYRRTLSAKPAVGKRMVLHFEAVDYAATVWLNGKELGSHQGGSTPFSFGISGALKDGENELTVRVHDETEGYQLRGKQALKPHGITATRVSGIWQTVWLEQLPERFVQDLDFETVLNGGKPGEGESATGVSQLLILPKLGGTPVAGESLRVTVSFAGKEVASGSGTGKLAIPIPEARLWTPATPDLYDLKVELLDGKGETLDTVASYTALRQVGKIIDARGKPRISLNGKEIFLLGPLDQGWWPDGLLTPPSDEAMLSDLKFIKAAGFNMVRKHVKVEPARYYWHCDRLGIAVWQDQVNAGMGPKSEPKGISPPWTRLNPDPRDADWPEEAHRQWVTEYKAMVDHLRDHPSVLIWCPFNEAWGQHRTMEIGKMAEDYDPSRLVCIASGGNFWPVGHIASQHHYPNPQFPMDDARFRDLIKVVGEMGGNGWPVEGHLWSPGDKSWGYTTPGSLDEWKSLYHRTMNELMPLREFAVSAAVYTQTSDFETEVNGLLTYDRIPKVDAAWLEKINRKIIEGRVPVVPKPAVAPSGPVRQ